MGLNGPDDPGALDFDLACTLRLQRYDIEVARAHAKSIAYEVGRMLVGDSGGQSAATNGNAPSPQTVPPPTKTESTERW